MNTTPDTAASEVRSAAGRPLIAVLGVIAAILVFAALYFASPIFAPVVCALFIIALVWPMQKRLQSHLPKLVALAIVILAAAVVFVVFASLITWSFGRVGRSLLSDAERFQLLYEQAATWLESHGITIAAIWAEHFDVRWLIRTAQGITAYLNTTVAFWLVVLIYLILGLLEVDDFARKIAALKNREAARVLMDGSVAIAAKLRRYMLIRTLMSVATGALVWGVAQLSGLQLAAEWGVIAFALNFIPFIGSFIATVFPTLFALAQFESWQPALLVFVCLNIVQFIVGSYIEPRVAGKALAISPFLVLFSVFFWTFLWGIFGAFIGVPIAIALLTLCGQHPSSAWLSDLLGATSEAPAAGKLR